MIKIDKKVPLPDNNGKFAAKYPYRLMEVGDSFLYPKDVNQNTARSGANQTGKRAGKRFIVRVVPEGLRCWRIE